MSDRRFTETKRDYEADLRVIKDFLVENSQGSLIEPWSFYVWGVFTIIGTLLHTYLYYVRSWSLLHVFLGVWLPILLAGAGAETWSWVVRSRKESIPLLNRMIERFFLSGMGVMIFMFTVVFLLISRGEVALLSKLILPILSVIFFLYSPVTYRFLTVLGYIVLALGFLLFFVHFDGMNAVLSGILSGIFIIIAGIGGRFEERRYKSGR